MWNGTKQTLSTLALSHGLNLGTRPLAADASVNQRDLTLCTRHPHQGIMRDRIAWQGAFRVYVTRHAQLPIPSSFIPGPHGQASRVRSSKGSLEHGLKRSARRAAQH
jgi:hypothetical protein